MPISIRITLWVELVYGIRSKTSVHTDPIITDANPAAAMKSFGALWYQKSSSSELKEIGTKDIKHNVPKSLLSASIMWQMGWSWFSTILEWLYKALCICSVSFQNYQIRSIVACQFKSNNPSAIFTALRFASKECKKSHQDSKAFTRKTKKNIKCSQNHKVVREMKVQLSFYHLFNGCNTTSTSALFNISKKQSWKLLRDYPKLRISVRTFTDPVAEK